MGGNIVSRIRYPYTEGDLTGLTATETHTYSYDNPTWGDVLTAYNGQPVTYDAMGNITSLGGDTYTWTAGRQLSRITKADNSYIDYYYDDNGLLSMYKIYDADHTLDGGSEYFWEGTRLIAVKLIESENETDGMTAFMRIIYDSDGEPLGFLLNDAMPFLYTKNILGDITGVVYYENADYLFRYAYDAYGNYELVPPDDSVAAEIMATIFHALNPLTYRGYIFTPAIGISHYLGSRFYVPQLCRFMNADVYADTAQGVVGTNMFAYCNNNPIIFIDPTGTSPLAIFKVAIPVGVLAVVVVFVVSAIGTAFLITHISNTIADNIVIFTADQVRSVINSHEEIRAEIDKHFKDMVASLSLVIYQILNNLILDSVASVKNDYRETQDHHIVAENDTRAADSKKILDNVNLSVNDKSNIVTISRSLHEVLHTNMYHTVVYLVLKAFTTQGNATKDEVFKGLALLRIVLLTANNAVTS